jgi:uncharacterized protein Yka (UPF0111/DUF47 family)
MTTNIVNLNLFRGGAEATPPDREHDAAIDAAHDVVLTSLIERGLTPREIETVMARLSVSVLWACEAEPEQVREFCERVESGFDRVRGAVNPLLSDKGAKS